MEKQLKHLHYVTLKLIPLNIPVVIMYYINIVSIYLSTYKQLLHHHTQPDTETEKGNVRKC